MDKVANRFMFDTNALNRICKDPYAEMIIYQSKYAGFEYFFTEIQCNESEANIRKKSPNVDPLLVERSRAEWATNLLRVIPKLQTKYVGQIATPRPGRWGLNGTFDVLPDNELSAFNMFSDILNDNDFQYFNDAMIAMTSIVHGCVLVTNDRRLYKKVNHHFPNRAVKYEEFLETIQASLDLPKPQ